MVPYLLLTDISYGLHIFLLSRARPHLVLWLGISIILRNNEVSFSWISLSIFRYGYTSYEVKMRTKFGLHLFIRIAVNVPFHRVIKPTMPMT